MAAALALTIVLALRAHRRPFPDAVAYLRTPPADAPTALLQRAARLRPFVPSQGSVGYVSDATRSTDSSVRYDPAVLHHVLRQYALAPTLVVRGQDFPLVVGDFLWTTPDTADLARRGAWRVQNFGDGIFLLTRRRVP